MSALDDVPLDKSGSAPPEGVGPEPKETSLVPRLVIGLVLGILVGLGYVLWRSQSAPTPPSTVEQTTAPPPAAEPVVETPVTAPEGDVPPLDESDATVRDVVGQLSAHRALRTWLALDDLARRFAAVTANLVAGQSPTVHVKALGPRDAFSVQRAGGRLFIAPASYARYDTIADVIGSLNTQATAAAYRTLRPLLEAAYRELGETTPLDAALSSVGQAVLDVPLLDRPPEVQEQGALYAFVDPRLEQRSAAQKHFLRMGPRNLRIIQQKLRDILTEAGLRADS